MKRYFNATPRLMVYFVAGVALVLMMLPYLLDWFPAHPVKENFILADEVTAAVDRPLLEVAQTLTHPILEHSNSPLGGFGGIRLDTPREEMVKTFDLHTLTVYGSDPEICEATKPTTVEHFTGCFAGGSLKEAFVVEHEQQASADALQQDLIKQYGMPTERIDNNGAVVPPASLLSSNAVNDWTSRMASLPFHRSLVWNDASYHIEASIHYSSADPLQSRAILAVHLRAVTSPLNQTLSQYTAHTLSVRPVVE